MPRCRYLAIGAGPLPIVEQVVLDFLNTRLIVTCVPRNCSYVRCRVANRLICRIGLGVRDRASPPSPLSSGGESLPCSTARRAPGSHGTRHPSAPLGHLVAVPACPFADRSGDAGERPPAA